MEPRKLIGYVWEDGFRLDVWLPNKPRKMASIHHDGNGVPKRVFLGTGWRSIESEGKPI